MSSEIGLKPKAPSLCPFEIRIQNHICISKCPSVQSRLSKDKEQLSMSPSSQDARLNPPTPPLRLHRRRGSETSADHLYDRSDTRHEKIFFCSAMFGLGKCLELRTYPAMFARGRCLKSVTNSPCPVPGVSKTNYPYYISGLETCV